MVIYLVIFLLSWGLTAMMRRYALKNNLLDVPNDRSSHVIPTPRGGGLPFVLCFLAMILILTEEGLMSAEECALFLLPCSVVALLGFLDDKYQLSAKWRLLGHLMMAALAVYLLGSFSTISFFQSQDLLINGGRLLAVFYLVWLLNLFNFMDGIDGIAAAEAICICVSGALLYFLHGESAEMMAPLLLAAAVGGFLVWNFPPARIFMGDVGSGFLGVVIGIFSIQAAIVYSPLFVCWLILAAVFITDATLTLFRRGLSGEPLFQAHCTHAYQQAAKRFGKHWPVTVSVILINLLWLLPLALLVEQKWISCLTGLVFAYLPLLLLAFKMNAGKPLQQNFTQVDF